jgi:hypothetical protein
MAETISAGLAYAYRLLEKWTEITADSEAYRKHFLMAAVNKDREVPDEVKDIQCNLIAKLTNFYGEIWPKVEGRTDYGNLPKQLEAMNIYYLNPTLLFKEENTQDIFRLTQLLRQALEKIGITKYEGN